MKLYKKLMLLLLCVLFFFNVSCSYEKISEFLFTSFTYESNIDVEFENDEDIQVFERRLEMLNVSIQSTTKNGNVTNYILRSHYTLTENDWQSITTEYDAEIIDENANTMLSKKDVRKVEFDGVCLNVYVADEFYERYDEVAIYHASIKIDGITYPVWPYIRDEREKYIEYIETPETSKSILFKAAIAFSNNSFSGNVRIAVNVNCKRV